MLINKESVTTRLSTTGPAIGLMANANYEEVSIKISDNDLLFLFTDGLSESMDKNANLYGEERIVEQIQKSANESSKEIVDEIKNSVRVFSSNTIEADDTTLMAIKIYKARA